MAQRNDSYLARPRLSSVTLLPLWLMACSTASPSGVDDSGATSASSTESTLSPVVSTTQSPTTPNPAPPAIEPGGTTDSAVDASSATDGTAPNTTTTVSQAPEVTTTAEQSDDANSGRSDDSTSTRSTDSAGPDTGTPTGPIATSSEPTETIDPGDCSPRADEHTAVGYGAATTGGGNSAAIEVASFAAAEAALESYRDAFESGEQTSLVLRYTGSFDYGTITDVCAQHTKDAQILYIKEVENVTLEGAPGSSANFGIKINRAKNVIVRNMTIGLLPGGGDSDAITIEGNGTNGDVEHVWIDHNDLFSDTKDDCEGAGDTEFDGLIDIKKGARYITLSYNHLHDHQKTGLLGSSDTDDMDRYVTFHHNWYENVISRTPLHRFGYIHLFNNYFDRILDSGINVRMGGVALIESNYFENAQNPVTSRYSDVVGYWDLRNNHVGNNVTWSVTEDTLANADTWESTAEFPASELTYDYQADSAACVKAIVAARAGATL